jgi:hypothetical protein
VTSSTPTARVHRSSLSPESPPPTVRLHPRWLFLVRRGPCCHTTLMASTSPAMAPNPNPREPGVPSTMSSQPFATGQPDSIGEPPCAGGEWGITLLHIWAKRLDGLSPLNWAGLAAYVDQAQCKQWHFSFFIRFCSNSIPNQVKTYKTCRN